MASGKMDIFTLDYLNEQCIFTVPPEAAVFALLFALLLLLPLGACSDGNAAMPTPPRRMASAGLRSVLHSPFQVEPYLQLGPGPASPERLTLLWHAQEDLDGWTVEIKPQSGEAWTRMARPVSVLVGGPGAHRVWFAGLGPLAPGQPFEYRVLLDGAEVFRTEAKALTGPGQFQRVVVAGDLALPASAEACAALRRIHQENPDLLVAAGGLMDPPASPAQYQRAFFSLYNAGQDDPWAGAPLMRSTVLVGALQDPGGRFCMAAPGEEVPFGPGQVHDGNPRPAHPPAPGNYCFRSGDAHWTVLDGRRGRLGDPALVAWLSRELGAAQNVPWRFVVCQRGNAGDPGLKSLWPLLCAGNVSIVFTGAQREYRRAVPPAYGPVAVATGAASYAMMEISASRVVFRQQDARGTDLDRFTLSQ